MAHQWSSTDRPDAPRKKPPHHKRGHERPVQFLAFWGSKEHSRMHSFGSFPAAVPSPCKYQRGTAMRFPRLQTSSVPYPFGFPLVDWSQPSWLFQAYPAPANFAAIPALLQQGRSGKEELLCWYRAHNRRHPTRPSSVPYSCPAERPQRSFRSLTNSMNLRMAHRHRQARSWQTSRVTQGLPPSSDV